MKEKLNILEIRDVRIMGHQVQHRDIFVWGRTGEKLSRLVGDTAIWTPVGSKVSDHKTEKYLASYYYTLKLLTIKQYNLAQAWGKSTSWLHTIPWSALHTQSIIYAWHDEGKYNLQWGTKRKDANEMRDLYHATHKDMIIKDFFV